MALFLVSSIKVNKQSLTNFRKVMFILLLFDISFLYPRLVLIHENIINKGKDIIYFSLYI